MGRRRFFLDDHPFLGWETLFQGVQPVAKLFRRLEPSFPGFLQALEDDLAHGRGNLVVELSGVLGRLALVLDGDTERRLAFERDLPRDHLEEDDPQGIFRSPRRLPESSPKPCKGCR